MKSTFAAFGSLLWACVLSAPEERVPVYTALEAVTVNAARQSFDEARKGILTIGKQADLVLLSADPLQTAAEDLLGLQVAAT
jgi:predicted amidohydrolase YtcJ